MSKKIVLKSSDGESFEIEEAAAIQSQTLAHMIEDNCAGSEIPLANINGTTLALVLEYCMKHTHVTDEIKEEVKKWDAEFTKAMDQSTLFDVLLAANYLNIQDLLDLFCQTVADMISGKTPDEIRTLFNIKNDFTPEEEEQNRAENQWAFQ